MDSKVKKRNMKVIAINGSPHKKGNTYHAISMVFEELEKENKSCTKWEKTWFGYSNFAPKVWMKHLHRPKRLGRIS